MATRTYYGKLDCYSSVASTQVLIDEMYKGTMDFLSYLSGSNEVDLITWNSGSGAAAATFENRTYSDGSFPFGGGAFSLWKFRTNSRRNWEWYLYLQRADATVSLKAATQYSWTLPITGSGTTGVDGIIFNSVAQNTRGIIMQAAMCVSGTTSFNPWNGSTSQGAANASIGAGNGSVRWVSGSDSRRLYVLPRSNDLGGVHVVQKANATPLVITAATSARYHFMYDGDALQVVYDGGANSTYAYNYMGGFELRSALTASGICGSDYGFLMYAYQPENQNEPTLITDTLSFNTTFGDVSGSAGASATGVNGGIVCPVKAAVSGSKGVRINVQENWSASGYQPSTYTSKFDEFPVLVGASESPFLGFLGNLNTGMVRVMRDVQVHDTTADFSRAVFAGTTTISNLSISTPWTGSNPPGISTARTGSQFTWTRDYK